jgi:hypothetical protein
MRMVTLDSVLNFGKYAGMKLSDVKRKDSGYYNWMLREQVISIVDKMPDISESYENARAINMKDSKWARIRFFGNPKPEDFDDITITVTKSSFSLKG